MPVNDSLLTAIQNKIAADSALTTLIPGGSWAGEIPEVDQNGNPVEPPYLYFGSPVFVTKPTFENEFESTQITFQAYALGYANCETLVRALKNTFDYKSLTFLTVFSVGIWPLRWRIYNERIRWKDNSLIHRGEVNYLMVVQRERNVISS